MFKLKLALSIVVAAMIIGASTAVTMAANLRGGTLAAMTPAAVLPASTDVYFEVNRFGQQGINLTTLSNVYKAHPGTAAALGRLETALGPTAVGIFNTLLTAFSYHVAIAAFVPSSSSGAAPGVAVVAQLKQSTLNTPGANPLNGLATFTPLGSSYMGLPLYRATLTGGAVSVYAVIVQGDGVLASDLPTLRRIIDSATGHTASLAMEQDFINTTAQVPAQRAFTIYTSRHLARLLYQSTLFNMSSVSSGGMMGMGASMAMMELKRLLDRPYAIGVVAQPNGFAVDTSYIPVSASQLTTTPNNGASAVGNTAILYESLDNLAGLLTASGLLTPQTVGQLNSQLGVDFNRDVLSLFRGELVLDVNDETSPTLQRLLLAGGLGAATSNLPGSVEIATEVQDPAAAQQSINRLVSALLRSSGSGLATSPFIRTTLSDGSVAYTLTGMPDVGYTFRGHFLIFSAALSQDIRALQTPLSSDADYTNALTHVYGTSPLVSVQYVNLARLYRVVDRYLAFASASGGASVSDTIAQVKAFEPLLTPFQNAATATHQVGVGEEQILNWVAVR